MVKKCKAQRDLYAAQHVRKGGTRKTEGRYKTVVNEYEIEQYLNWRNTDKIE